MLPVILSNRPFTAVLTDRLVKCIAHGIESPTEVAGSLGVSVAALTALIEDPEFQDRVLDARAQWNEPSNAALRTRVKADIVLEEALPRMDSIIHSDSVAPKDSISAVALTHSLTSHQRELAELKVQERVIGTGGGQNNFVLNITLPDPQGVQQPVFVGRGEPLPDAVTSGNTATGTLEHAA